MNVVVRADSVTGVTVTPSTLEMMVGESRDLGVVVEPYAALNKNVTYTTSNSSVVTVSKTGKLKAVGTGTAIITVKTVDGGFTATCTVTVTEKTPPLLFDFTGVAGMQQMGTGYLTADPTVDLMQGLKVDETIDQNEISFRVASDSATVDENGVLTFTQQDVVTVEAFVGDSENPTYRVEIRIAWQQ